jgi:peptidoglycan/xylan/chitin deacetylase (PgdA/CDA1 family)
VRPPASVSVTRAIGIANAVVILIAVVALIVMPGSGPAEQSPKAATAGQSASKPPPIARPSSPPASEPPPVVATPDFAKQVKANEAGLIPVIMYHRIVRKRVASIDRTPAQLRKELVRLAKSGYVPITARDFAAGRIQVPAGKFPVVLTFDDGHETHFRLGPDGQPKKDTAVAIIQEVAAEYPSFRPVATFWVNHQPFGLREREKQAEAVKWLHERGHEVANHTWGHPNLRVLPAKKVREHIVRLERMLAKLGVPPSRTLALPYGNLPRKKKTARKGEWDGTRFSFDGVFLAGAEPSLSPFAKDYDPGAIQRIQSNGKKGECRKWCSQYWLEWLDKRPGWRYVSDGDPERVSVPRKLRGNINPKRRAQVNAY